MELCIYDLIMFRNNKTTSISLETIHTIKNIKGIHICETNNFRFDESNLNVLREDLYYLEDWNKYYNSNIKIVGIWRFNNQTKNYDNICYEV